MRTRDSSYRFHLNIQIYSYASLNVQPWVEMCVRACALKIYKLIKAFVDCAHCVYYIAVDVFCNINVLYTQAAVS